MLRRSHTASTTQGPAMGTKNARASSWGRERTPASVGRPGKAPRDTQQGGIRRDNFVSFLGTLSASLPSFWLERTRALVGRHESKVVNVECFGSTLNIKQDFVCRPHVRHSAELKKF